MSVVAIDLLGRVAETRTVAYEPASGDVKTRIAALAALVRRVIKRLPRGQLVQGICVTVPGLVDRDGVVFALLRRVGGGTRCPCKACLALD